MITFKFVFYWIECSAYIAVYSVRIRIRKQASVRALANKISRKQTMLQLECPTGDEPRTQQPCSTP